MRLAPLLLLLVGCVPVPIDDFCVQLARKYCQAVSSCCGRMKVNTAGCTTSIQGACRVLIIGRAYTATAKYDPAVGARCIADLEASSKDCASSEVRFERDFQLALNGCFEAVPGTLGLGAGCEETPEDCAPGTYCGPDDTCVAISKVGESCDARCEPGATCIFSPGVGQGTCVARIDEGGACDPQRQLCTPGTFCEQLTRTCQLLKNSGESCASNSECASGVCDAGVCDGESGQCTDEAIP